MSCFQLSELLVLWCQAVHNSLPIHYLHCGWALDIYDFPLLQGSACRCEEFSVLSATPLSTMWLQQLPG